MLPPAHPALLARPSVLRRSDPGDAFAVIARRYGEPTGYCVLGGNVAAVSSWTGLSFADQYQAVTAGAGVFPCGGMYYLSLTGPHAADVLNLLSPRRFDRLEVGQATFAIFTTPEGTVDTEGVVLRVGPDAFQVSIGGETNPPTWLYDALERHPGTVAQEADLSSFNIKGPRRMEAMARLLSETHAARLATLGTFRGMPVRTRWGADAWVVRTVIGVELWASAEVTHEAWQAMTAEPAVFTPCGWDLLATYRLECPDFAFYLCPLDIHRGTYLFDAGLGHVVSPERTGEYVGRQALSDPARWGGRLWIGGLRAADPDAGRRRIGEPLPALPTGGPAGYVTSAGHSPRAGRELCFAHLDVAVRPGDTVGFADGTTWQVVPLPIQPPAP
ncbi:aminomethyltransferase [Catellatospora methionotrophica]|uniref:Aminomethyltransferase n=1 Tax=Catellatospora methionotrophica TaxID=121620 RepID=A0A8J3L508_9ACTN|nr:aminomethyl transferase family protein [Catellatospora methionotrophica]GIG14543.1 aminomethyltransferase [Catellatospora methionotrophica]